MAEGTVLSCPGRGPMVILGEAVGFRTAMRDSGGRVSGGVDGEFEGPLVMLKYHSTVVLATNRQVFVLGGESRSCDQKAPQFLVIGILAAEIPPVVVRGMTGWIGTAALDGAATTRSRLA